MCDDETLAGTLCDLVGNVLSDATRAPFTAWFSASAVRVAAPPLRTIADRIVAIVTRQITLEIVCESPSPRFAAGRATLYLFGCGGGAAVPNKLFAVSDTMLNERELCVLYALALRPAAWTARTHVDDVAGHETLCARDEINDALDAGLDRAGLVRGICIAVLRCARNTNACARALAAALTCAATHADVLAAGYGRALLEIVHSL
ncbi:MAG TPA: hypothetical protein VI565_01560 [Burkholderiales bacterium]|nr:hypothetical protein [Burkholderiales bacterium]